MDAMTMSLSSRLREMKEPKAHPKLTIVEKSYWPKNRIVEAALDAADIKFDSPPFAAVRFPTTSLDCWVRCWDRVSISSEH